MADGETHHMEMRVTALEDGLNALRKDVNALKETLHSALLGTLDGKAGMVQTLHNSLEASRINAAKLDAVQAVQKQHGEQLDGLRLDRAKVTGIIIAVSVAWAAFGTIIGIVIKLWK